MKSGTVTRQDKPVLATPPVLLPPGFCLAAESALRTASLLLAVHEESELIGAQLLGAVGYCPPKARETPRFWPIEIQVLTQAIQLLDHHAGVVGQALARQFERSAGRPAR